MSLSMETSEIESATYVLGRELSLDTLWGSFSSDCFCLHEIQELVIMRLSLSVSVDSVKSSMRNLLRRLMLN